MGAGHGDAEGALRGRLVANGHEFAPRTEGVAEQEAFLKAMTCSKPSCAARTPQLNRHRPAPRGFQVEVAAEALSVPGFDSSRLTILTWSYDS